MHVFWPSGARTRRLLQQVSQLKQVCALTLHSGASSLEMSLEFVKHATTSN